MDWTLVYASTYKCIFNIFFCNIKNDILKKKEHINGFFILKIINQKKAMDF
jgi:hypothetical protein